MALIKLELEIVGVGFVGWMVVCWVNVPVVISKPSVGVAVFVTCVFVPVSVDQVSAKR